MREANIAAPDRQVVTIEHDDGDRDMYTFSFKPITVKMARKFDLLDGEEDEVVPWEVMEDVYSAIIRKADLNGEPVEYGDVPIEIM